MPASAPAGRDALAYSFVKGLAAIRDNTPAACVTAFNDAIERADGFIGFALFQGDCYAASGHDRDAVAAWQMALLGNVGTPVIYEQLVDGLLRLNEGEEALAALAEGDLVWTRPARVSTCVAASRSRCSTVTRRRCRCCRSRPTIRRPTPACSSSRCARCTPAARPAGSRAGSDVLARYDGYLERYLALKGPQAAIAREWRKGFGEVAGQPRLERPRPRLLRDVLVDGRVEFRELHVLVVGVRHEDRAGAEEERRAPAVEERHVGREREHRGLEAGHGGQLDRRHVEDRRPRHEVPEPVERGPERRQTRPTVRNITSASACGGMTFGATPPADQADRVVRAAEQRIARAASSARSRIERVDQLVDRRLAQLRETTSAPPGPRP